MLHLRTVEMTPIPASKRDRFPYDVSFVRAFERLDFTTDVTFLVGENGSGKSTFLEVLACAAGSITVGAESVNSDPSLAAVRQLAHDQIKLTWSKRTKHGFFMRSEDFFGYARKLSRIRSDMQAELDRIDEEFADQSEFARNLARMPYVREIQALEQSYGESLDSYSHGESFFRLFRERFTGEGLYLLDEPEAPLSPNRQLSLISMIHMMVQQGGQFVIATHSPLLMALPGAKILSFDDGTIREVAWDKLDHVTITRSFLNDPSAYLRHLLESDD